MKEILEVVYEKGILRPLKKLSYSEGRVFRITLETSTRAGDETRGGESSRNALLELGGTLKSSPRFNGDPLMLQKALRDEWS